MNLINYLGDFFDYYGSVLLDACWESFVMVSISMIGAIVLGVPLAICLVLTRPGQALENRVVSGVLNSVINVLRSLPFIILLFFILPFTKLIVGTTIGIPGAIVPLIIYSAPYLARLVENSLLEVDKGVLEAYEGMGFSTTQIVFRVWIPEAMSSLILSLTTMCVGLIGATAMAGLVGAGGLGDLAYRYGFQRFQPDVMIITVIVLVIIIQGIQTLGNKLSLVYKRNPR